MIQSGSERTGLDRPKGYMPRRTSLGIAGVVLLTVGVPMGLLISAAPVTTGGLERMLSSLPYVLGFGLLVVFVVVFSAFTRRYWAICLFFYFGVILLLSYAAALVFAFTVVTGLIPNRNPDLWVMGVVGLIYLSLLILPSWFLVRALRLRYWQPGSTPDQWEPGDETPPAWAMSPSRRNGR